MEEPGPFPVRYFLRVRLLLDVDPEPGDVDQQTDGGDREELELQVERQDLEQQLDLALEGRSEDEQLHVRLLLLTLALACFFVYVYIWEKRGQICTENLFGKGEEIIKKSVIIVTQKMCWMLATDKHYFFFRWTLYFFLVNYYDGSLGGVSG